MQFSVKRFEIKFYVSGLSGNAFSHQENWLSENQLQLLNKINNCFLCTGVSGFDNSDVLRGGHTAAVRFFGDQIFFLHLTLYL